MSRRRDPAPDARAPDLAALAGVIGEPARARMLVALMHGKALSATELALEADIASSTASSHLSRLRSARLVDVVAQGRHRYFRIATAETAQLLEQLITLAPLGVRTGPRDPTLRRARVCYDHLAGELGVRLCDRLLARGILRRQDDALLVGDAGEAWLRELGVDVAALRAQKRPLLRACLDWSERRDHVAGALGAAMLTQLLERRLVRRDPLGRALLVAPRGEDFFARL